MGQVVRGIEPSNARRGRPRVGEGEPAAPAADDVGTAAEAGRVIRRFDDRLQIGAAAEEAIDRLQTQGTGRRGSHLVLDLGPPHRKEMVAGGSR